MQRKLQGPSMARQWGKAGPIMALVSILLIGVLAKVTLAQLGFTQEAAKAVTAAPANGPALEGDDDDAAAQTPASKATADAPKSPSNAMEKARAVQGLVNRQAAKTESQIESEGK